MANKTVNKRAPKAGVKTNSNRAKTKTSDRRNKKKLSASLLCFLKTEDELSKIKWDSVPLSIKKWLSVSFAEEKGCQKPPEEGSEVQANVWKEKKVYIRSSPCDLDFPEEVRKVLKDVDQWSFDVFALHKASGMKSLKYMMCELFSKYNLLDQFKIPVATLISFAEALDIGYNKYKNAYHNSVHAADVIQTVHSFIIHTGMMHWFTDLEILALIFSASIHDYEHTGTTNHFHVLTRSETAILYNDFSVLENHHISAAYKLMQQKGLNILANLTDVQWRELRHLVIKLVLATDISQHFQNMSFTRQLIRGLQQKERPDKTKVMCMMLHTADISHPAKPWELAYKWAEGIMDELFKQGDMEAKLGLPISAFCDRKTTDIAESQIVFIDIFIQPSFFLLLEAIDKIVAFLQKKASRPGSSSRESGQNTSKKKKSQETVPQKRVGAPEKRSSPTEEKSSPTEKSETHTEKHIVIVFDVPQFKANLLKEIETNKNRWKGALRKETPGKGSDKASEQVKKGKGSDHGSDQVNKGKGSDHGSDQVNKGKGSDQGSDQVNKGKGSDQGSDQVNKGKGSDKASDQVNKGSDQVNKGKTSDQGSDHVNKGKGSDKTGDQVNKSKGSDQGSDQVNKGKGCDQGSDQVNKGKGCDQGSDQVNKGKGCDQGNDQVNKGKCKGRKTQKASQDKDRSAGLKRHCVSTDCPITSKRQASDKTAFSPLDVNFVVYNADSSELLQPQDSCIMEVTESYAEFVDSEVSQKKAAAKNVAAHIKKMRKKIPKSKPLGPGESDDIIIEEIIPDDSQDQLTSEEFTGQDDAQQPTNAKGKCATTNQSDLDLFSVWDEEIKSHKAEQQKKQQRGKRAATQGKQNKDSQRREDSQNKDSQRREDSQNKDSQRRKGKPATFILQVISVDVPSGQGGTGEGTNHDPRQQEMNETPDQESVKTTPADTEEEDEIDDPCGAAAVSISPLDCEIYKIPL